MNAIAKRASIVIASITVVAAVLFFCLQGAPPSSPVSQFSDQPAAQVASIPAKDSMYVPGELIVSLADQGAADGATLESASRGIEEAGFEVATTLSKASEYAGSSLLVATDKAHRLGDDLAQAAQAIAGIPGVSAVQPNYRYATNADVEARSVAYDEAVGEQWYLNGPASHGANMPRRGAR